MTFFDKKEEVMKVELTPYGRYLLSIGRLKPSHYRFFDNNVVYDTKATGRTEHQNEADVRIRQNTPVLKQNSNITGVETGIQLIETENLEVTDCLDNFRQTTKDDHINSLIYQLGTSEYDSVKSAAYQVDAFNGTLLPSTNKFYASENIQTSSVPQIDVEVEYSASAGSLLLQVTDLDPDVFYQSDPFDDGTRINIKKGDPLLRILERSAFDEKDNFTITCYKVDKSSVNSRLTYKKMNFQKKSKQIVDDMYINAAPIQDIEPSRDDVPYYFEILVDKEIAESDYCRTVGDLPIKNIYLDDETICPDVQQGPNINIYVSSVSPDDLEDCD